MKKLLLMLIAVLLFSAIGYSQTPCPAGVTAITLNVPKPVTNGMKVGGITYCDPDNAVTVTQTLTPTIVETQTLYKLTIIGNSADIIVNDATAVNNSAASTVFSIKVIDNGTNPPNLSTTAVITINYVNSPPVMNPQTFSIAENSAVGTVVGTVIASDPNTSQTKTYSIVSGNVNSTFSINATTGAIIVTNVVALNYEATTRYALVIKVQDNGTPSLSTQATMTINVTNVNEAPVIVAQ